MNRTALAITMLRILKTRSIVKKEELAELLETNPRNIIGLKQELEVAGYDIEAIGGKNGGYRLADDSLLVTPNLTNEEVEALQEVLSYLKGSDTMLRRDAESALQKVLSVNMKTAEGTDVYSSGTRLVTPLNALQKTYETVSYAVNEKLRLKVSYKTGNQKVAEWTIHPYGMFLYKGMWYLVGYRESDHEITMKLNRIHKVEVTDIHFSKPDDFNIRKYATEYGINVRGENHLKAVISGRYYISEYIYGENQKIETIDDHTILFEADFPNELTLKSFVLDLSSDCEVLEPGWLREYVLEENRKVKELYQ